MGQQRQIVGLGQFDRAQRGEMRRGELAIEQFRAAKAQGRDQPGQRHFRRIGFAGKHTLAAKYAGKAHAIEPADQPFHAIGPGRPCFDGMGCAQGV
jgi:hypothetical protein